MVDYSLTSCSGAGMKNPSATTSKKPNSSRSPKKRFIKFILIILFGVGTSYIAMRQGMRLTPESFKELVLSLGIWGPVIYTATFIVRPIFLIPSIALFIAGGLAFGPVIGPLYASAGAAMGGTVGFWIARKMGHDFVMSKLKLGSGAIIESTKFSFSAVFILSLIPVMPVTVINYGSGLSTMKFKNYILAHVLGMTPRAFAFGFFGSSLLEIGSNKFRAALLILVILSLAAIWMRIRKQKSQGMVSKPSPDTQPE